MKTILPNFNSQRMILDYATQFYGPAIKHSSKLLNDNYKSAGQLAKWKKTIRTNWNGVTIRLLDTPPTRITAGDTLSIHVAVGLNGLSASDVIVECVVGVEDEQKAFHAQTYHPLLADTKEQDGEAVFSIKLVPELSGLQFYKLRVYPHHSLLAHRFEIGCMHWI